MRGELKRSDGHGSGPFSPSRPFAHIRSLERVLGKGNAHPVNQMNPGRGKDRNACWEAGGKNIAARLSQVALALTVWRYVRVTHLRCMYPLLQVPNDSRGLSYSDPIHQTLFTPHTRSAAVQKGGGPSVLPSLHMAMHPAETRRLKIGDLLKRHV